MLHHDKRSCNAIQNIICHAQNLRSTRTIKLRNTRFERYNRVTLKVKLKILKLTTVEIFDFRTLMSQL